MKSARITLLGTPEFKAWLSAEAAREGVSVSELVRRRCERVPTKDEEVLAVLSTELLKAATQARQSIEEGLAAIRQALADNCSEKLS